MDVTMRNELATPTLEALVAGTETKIEFTDRDDKMVLIIQNEGDDAAETSLTVKAGNGIQGVNDLVLTVPVGVSLLKLESGRFKFVSGENKDHIVVKSAGTPKIGIASLI